MTDPVRPQSPYLLHLIHRPEWHGALTTGALPLAAEGFVHLSTFEQVSTTAGRYYAGADDLVALAIDRDAVADELRWEESHPGEHFPHVYATIPVAAVVAVLPFPPPFALPAGLDRLGDGTGVRRATAERDASTIPAAGDIVDGRRPPLTVVEPARAERYRRLLAEPGGVSLVYEEDGEVRAAVVSVPTRADYGRGAPVAGSAHVGSVATHPDAQGRGLASLLLHHLDEALVAAGFDRAELWTQVDNQRARRLYERHGWRRSNAPNAIDAVGDTIVHYERRLA